MQSDFQLALTILPIEFWNTIYMVFVSFFFASIIGFPIGIILTVSDRGRLRASPFLYKNLEALVNIGRSFPFAILMVALIPFTRWITGTSLGTGASIVPLTLAAAPMIAKVVEISLKEVNEEIIEAAIVMGSKNSKIIRMMLHESLPNLISSITLTVVSLIGYSAMAGLVGGGGLGQIAVQYGYYRFNTMVMILTVLLLIFLVQMIQFGGDALSNFLSRKWGKFDQE